MALWGVSDSDESKPKYLSTADKKNCIAKPEVGFKENSWFKKSRRDSSRYC